MVGILGNYMFHAILPIHMMAEMHASVVTQSEIDFLLTFSRLTFD
jgi:hypothetical protein